MRPRVKEERANPLKSNGFSLSTALSSSSSFPFLLPSSSMASHFSPKPSSLSVPPHSSYILFRRFPTLTVRTRRGLGFPVNFPNGRTFFRRSTGRLSDGCLNLLCKSSHPTTYFGFSFLLPVQGWEGGFAGRRVGSRWRETVALKFLGSAYSWRQHVFSESDQHEFKHNHEEWINSVKPILDASISSQLHDVLEVADTEIENCQSARMEIRSALNSLLKVLNLYCMMSDEIVRSLGPGRFLDWKVLNAKGTAGGVIICWDKRSLEILGVEEGQFSISCRFRNEGDGAIWVFTGVYGPFPEMIGRAYGRNLGQLEDCGRSRGAWEEIST
ncbi:Translocon at the outer membrane of chloroplasts 64 [Vitis vinifera]|uniref:Translocon at the outer membrane of chloroplasts 64 n=1 Tax=Vitis vinifera TaxID=29760 RepID=A0A438CDW2_VITVI|nr:Translocon at the outer membrane of chloroplasts 64 [Vitis vinifera]